MSEPTLLDDLESAAWRIGDESLRGSESELLAARLREAAKRLREAFEGVQLGDELARFSALDVITRINGGPPSNPGAR